MGATTACALFLLCASFGWLHRPDITIGFALPDCAETTASFHRRRRAGKEKVREKGRASPPESGAQDLVFLKCARNIPLRVGEGLGAFTPSGSGRGPARAPGGGGRPFPLQVCQRRRRRQENETNLLSSRTITARTAQQHTLPTATAIPQSPPPLATPVHLAAPPRRSSPLRPLCCRPDPAAARRIDRGRNVVTAPA